jgi:hypothetical protein
MRAICDQALSTEHGKVTRGEVGSSIGLDPDHNHGDAIEFRDLARELENRGHIERETTWYEVFHVTDHGLRACEKLS